MAVDAQAGMACGEILKKALSGKKFKKVVACRCGETLLDLSRTISETCTELTPVYDDTPEGLAVIRHSAAHIMAEAVKRLFPSAKVTIGPAIENGFYYDFDFERPFTPEDLTAIEAEIEKIVAADAPFVRKEMSKAEARALFDSMGETYKGEIMDDLGGDEFSVYTQGGFVDLCRGPHVPSTGFLKAFKLTSVAGAYWRGDEKNKMLQRIYGTAFATAKELKEHLDRIEEAKKRDHRKLGPQLDLFSFQERGGAGMAYWHPKGALLRTILEDFVNREMLRRDYDIVRTPQILKRELWEASGHYDNYRENMYFTEIDEQPYGVKPMNCVAHMLIYNSHLRSYRDLPKRYFEFGVVHRHEKSGVLHGLLRVRQFTQDDAHIICRPDQLQDEIKGVMRWIQDLMGLFGFEYTMELSTRPEKSIGSDEDWERATVALVDAMESMGLPYEVNEGDGAFYGPKIDVKLHDCLGREWQCSTIQVDFTLPERFDMVYIGEDGERHRPVMVHRAIMGSVERFIGVLTEHFAGAFPTWLAPVQARILTVTDAQHEFAEKARLFLREHGIRVEADLRNEKLGYKVREAQLEKVPYLLVVGDKEVEAQGVNVRLRGENLGLKTLEETVNMVLEDCREPFKRGGMSYSFSSYSCPV
ncbi:threonine--tRNA ligase [Desulfobaculum xiamenense]|nr:threonine--tRNA ligase [Desulfobaculum xiamenense]